MSEIEGLIDSFVKRFPGESPEAMNRYFKAIHQDLTPLARNIERERDELAAQVGRLREQLRQAIPAVRNTAPPGWRLVPAEPTPEMIEAALDAHMPFGDMSLAIQCANSAAPEVPHE